MGAKLSSLTLEELSKEVIADVVAAQGKNFARYASLVLDNGISGDVLADMNAELFSDALDELEVKSKLHRRVLRKLFERKAKTKTPKDVHLQLRSNVHERCTAALEEYFSDDPMLVYGGLHLIVQEELVPLICLARQPNGSLLADHTFAQNMMAPCSFLVKSFTRDSLVQHITQTANPGNDLEYVAHVVCGVEGKRVATVCAYRKMVPASPESNFDSSQSDTRLVTELSRTIEECIRRDGSLLALDITLGTESVMLPVIDSSQRVVMPGLERENIPPVTAAQVQAHSTRTRAKPDEDFCTHRAKDMITDSATSEQMAHLGDTFFEAYDTYELDRPKISSNDLYKCAAVEAFGLHNIDPQDPMVPKLRHLVETTLRLYNFTYARIQLLNHDKVYFLCETRRGELSEEEENWIATIGDTLVFDKHGQSVVGVMPRKFALICNYAWHVGRIFVVPDIQKDETFRKSPFLNSPLRAYIGCPILDEHGLTIATMLLLDTKPRYDFDVAHEIQLQHITSIIEQSLENWSLRRNVKRLEEERLSLSRRISSKPSTPEGSASIVFTDVQGSTSLWENNASATEAALMVHDSIIRKCIAETNGYEITTEGDAFQVAFHEPSDAVAFALKAQMELHDSSAWPKEILEQPDARHDPDQSMKGLRVRMGIHHGPVTTTIHKSTSRTRFSGETVKLAKSTESMSHGGQILLTEDVWRIASGLSEAFGIKSQAIDLGEHIMLKGDGLSEGVIAKRIIQLVPGPLAYDYYGARRQQSFRKSEAVCDSSELSASLGASRVGRRFPKPISKGQISKSFHDAPMGSGKATFVFIYAVGLQGLNGEEQLDVLALLGKTVRQTIAAFDGYECKEENGVFMVAFAMDLAGVHFGLSLVDRLRDIPYKKQLDLRKLVKLGIHSGAFTCCGPQAVTGRADYFGRVVNRAARVAGAAQAAQVLLGTVVVGDSVVSAPDNLGDLVKTELHDIKLLKGLTDEMALFLCCWS